MDTTKTNSPLTRTEGIYEACQPVFHYPAEPGERVSELENLIALDLETAGLNEQGDQVLEIHARSGSIIRGRFVACNMQYGDVVVGGSYTYVFPLSGDIREWHPAVISMHSANGLLAEAHAQTSEIRALAQCQLAVNTAIVRRFSDVDGIMAKMFPKLPGKRLWTLLGNSVHFDQRFIRRVFPQFAQGLSHRVFDVSTVRMFCEVLGLPYSTGEAAHRATEDVDASVRLLHEYVDFCQAVPDVPEVNAAALGSQGFFDKCAMLEREGTVDQDYTGHPA